MVTEAASGRARVRLSKRVSLGLSAIALIFTGGGLQALQAPPQATAPPTAVLTANVWATHVANAPINVDHQPWDVFLEGATLDQRGITRIAFSALPGQPREVLDQYIAWLVTLKPSEWSRDQQLAYWLNLHNALTVSVVADRGGRGALDRMRQFPASAEGPFATPIVTIEGRSLSVDGIVNEVLRPNFSDVPFHYGVFSGAEGGPSLRRRAFTGHAVRTELDEEARRYINGRGVNLSRRGLRVSKLYEWYAGDFGGTDAAVLDHVRGYAEGRLKSDLATRTAIDHYDYDFGVVAFVPRRIEPGPFLPQGPSFEPNVGGGS